MSETKIKAGVFVGPQIRQIMKDETFPTTLNPKELAAWSNLTVKAVTDKFLGNERADNYEEMCSICWSP